MSNSIVTWMLMATVVAGCSSNTTLQRTGGPIFDSQVRLFGLLEKVGSDYRFTRFRTDGAGDGTWVDLQTGKPTWATPTRRCGRGLIKDRKVQVPNCDELINEAAFMEAEFDGTDAAIRVIGAPLTFGMTLTGASFDVKFNVEKYAAAYQQAVAALDRQKLGAIGKELTRLLNDWRSVSSEYELALRKNAVTIAVEDMSGFNPGQLDFSSKVRVMPLPISPRPSTFEAPSLEVLLNSIAAAGATVRPRWTEERALAGSKCEGGVLANYQYTVECPKNFEVTDGAVRGSAKVTVLAREIGRLNPPIFASEDNVIALNFDGQRVRFTNKTNQYVSIDSVSVYYGDDVRSLPLKVSLSPQSRQVRDSEISLSDFKLYTKALKRFTKMEIQSQSLAFGFAVKYRIGNISQEKTLYVQRQYPYLELI